MIASVSFTEAISFEYHNTFAIINQFVTLLLPFLKKLK